MFVLSFPQETCDQAPVDGVSVTELCLEGCGGGSAITEVL